MYDFTRCKLCTEASARPAYRLPDTTVYACTACGFHYIDHLDQMPASTVEGRTTLDSASRRFIEARLTANRKQHESNVRLLSRHSELKGARCLDVGAGAGMFPALLKNQGTSVAGIEPQKVFRDFCQEKFGIALHAETLDHEKWREPADLFDIVTMWDVLEHVNFPAETLQQAYRLLKPGGLLFLDTPCRDSVAYRAAEWLYRLSNGSNTRLLQTMYSPLPFRHKQIFYRQQLLAYLQQTGFTIASTSPSLYTLRSKVVIGCRKHLSTTGD